MKTRGFTLVELMVVVALVAILATVAVPNLMAYQQASVAQDLASRFTDAVNWSRQSAMTTSQSVTLAMSANCTWTVTAGTSLNAKYSLTAAQRAQSYSSAACNSLSGTLTFSPSGMVTGTTALATPAASYQVLASGTVFRALTSGG